ncbi:MAG: hypothetical protein DRJ65_01625 [Acidobacteria bacterium]|nr:MAG: hypothetical protein DRJ65_01625 [Acidobacteriota bacterium]
MPVTRYRSVESMPPPWRNANDPGNLRNVAMMMDFYVRMTADAERARGVRKYKSIEEAYSDRGDSFRMGCRKE